MDTQYLVAAAVVGIVILLWLANRVNAKHDAMKEEQGDSPDAKVAKAWDAFGGTADLAKLQLRMEKLLRRVDLAQLESKDSLSRLMLMCIRSETYAPMRDIAARVKEIDEACGEAMAIEGLAEAYGGDAEHAAKSLDRARDGLAACAACAGFDDSKALLQEVLIAIDALESGEKDLRRVHDDEVHRTSLDPSTRDAETYAQLAARSRASAHEAREGDLELSSADEALERSEAWVERESNSADAWVAKGFALLRKGRHDDAEAAFDRALSFDEECWPAQSGLAAIFWDRESQSLQHIDALGELGASDSHLDQVLADLVENWSTLTERERAMLRLSARPLGEVLDKVLDAGARLRIVPIHLRARDADVAGSGIGDTIHFDANTFDSAGVFASARRAALRWDALCDASARSQWFAARVLALLASPHLGAKEKEKLAEGEKGLDTRVLARRFAAAHAERVKSAVLAKFPETKADEPAKESETSAEAAG